MIIALWVTAALLSFIGVFAAVQRTYIIATTLATQADQRPALSAPDARNARLVARLRSAAPGSARERQTGDFIRRFADHFTSHPVHSLVHLVPGALMLILMPLQFSRRIRARYIRFHRWSGRSILVLGLGVAVSAFYFGVLNPLMPGIVEPLTFLLFDGLFVFFATRGFLAIRHRDTARHREWMIRAYATVAAIATVRLVMLPLSIAFRDVDPAELLMVAFWVGWVSTIGAAEWWIRASRGQDAPVAYPFKESEAPRAA